MWSPPWPRNRAQGKVGCRRNSEDFADGASRPFDADLSEPFVGNHRVGLPTKSQPRLRIEVKSRPDGNFALDTPYMPNRANLAHGRLPSMWFALMQPPYGTSMPQSGRRPQHQKRRFDHLATWVS